MSIRTHKRWIAAMMAGALVFSSVGCTVPDTDTLGQLTDVAASTAGSLIQIAIKAILTNLLNSLAPIDLTAPISDQMH